MAAPVSRSSGQYWIVPLARAATALVAAAVITFTAAHSATFGLLVFGGYAVLEGLVVAVGSRATLPATVVRPLALLQGLVGVVAGIAALVFAASGLGLLLYLVSVWAALTGVIELYCGIRGSAPAARDWLVGGGFTALLAVTFVLIPADSVLAVGLFGAYAAVIAVYLGIGGFSLKWSSQQPGPTETRSLEASHE